MKNAILRDASISWSAPTAFAKRFAFGTVLVSALLFAAMVPFAKEQLAAAPAFIPVYETALVVLDLVAFLLLVAEANALRSRALVTLACGYLFTAALAAAHMMTFPGLFAPAGLLGAGPQSTAWLYMFWHGAFPLFVIGYALLKRNETEDAEVRKTMAWSILAALLLAVLLIALSTAGKEALPAIMTGNRYTPAMALVVGGTWLLSLMAIGTLWYRKPHSVLDLWLMVGAWAWVFDIALSAVLNAGRFDLGFYAGRIYGLVATGTVLVTLLVQDAKLGQQLRNRTIELQRAKDEALRAERAKGMFLATMSHEIRTPMNGVMGLLELLSMGRLDGEQRTMVEIVRQSSRSLLRIIDDILDFSKIEAGKLTLLPEPTSMRELVERVRNIYSGNASAKGLLLEAAVDAEVGGCYRVDGLRLQQILNNLVSNAIKFTQSGRVSIRVERVARRAKSDVLRFTVEDTGIGIAADDLARLFEPYVQATSRNSGGTGLGLVICNLLTTLMGGSLKMESEPGKGTRVAFTMALETAQAAAPAAGPVATVNRFTGRSLGEEPVHGGNHTVLLVDDHPVNRMVLEKQLAFLGYEIVTATNGLDALARLDQGGIGLVITDCHMPQMDGYDFARTVREREAGDRRGRLPIIACTANASANEAAYCFAAGMSDYLAKPVQLEQLQKKLDHWFPLRASRATA